MGRYDEAQANANQGLMISKQYNNQQDIANALGVLGAVCLVRVDYKTALEYLTDSYKRFMAIKHFRAIVPLTKLVSANRGMGNLDQALEHLKTGIKMQLKSKKVLFSSYALSPAALCLTDLGADQLAVTIYTLAQQYPNIAKSRWADDLYGKQMRKFMALHPSQTVREARAHAKELDIWDALRLVLDVIETSS